MINYFDKSFISSASEAYIDSSGGKVFLFSLCEMILKNGCLSKPDITLPEQPGTVSFS